MPRPIKKSGIAYRAFPKHLLERPKLAAIIGTIAAQWGFIDRTLLDIFERASSTTFSRNAIAVAIFDTLGAQGPKLDLIETVLKHRLPKAIQEKWAELRGDIQNVLGNVIHWCMVLGK